MAIETLIYDTPTQKLPLVPQQKKSITSFVLLIAMLSAIFLLAAILPLRGLWFYDMFLTTPVGRLLLLPTHLLFPTNNVTFFKVGYHVKLPEPLTVSFQQTSLLFMSIAALFVPYLLAVRYLPLVISRRFLLLSTMLLGICLLLIPVATSQDIFSYIMYARLGVIYHLNPLTALPTAARYDLVYPRVYWVNQPSAYGPTWAILTSALQWVALKIGLTNPLWMVLLLRLVALAAHLGSTQLIWSISGSLQRITGVLSPKQRMLATLAFAWNPLLLVEAAVNAHNDIILLFLLLLAIWTLVNYDRNPLLTYAGAASLLAIAASLKITLILLAPGLFLYILSQRLRYQRTLKAAFFAGVSYIATIVLLYAPFWQNGAVLHILQTNPGIMHTINTPYEFFIRLAASWHKVYIAPATLTKGSPIELLSHQISVVLFASAYILCCIYYLFSLRRSRHTPSRNNITLLLRWMALVWFLYCLVGTPWFWPWYAITFFGPYALLEAISEKTSSPLSISALTPAVRVLSFSLLSVYGFLTIAGLKGNVPGIPHFQWSYFAGLWIWLLPLLILFIGYKKFSSSRSIRE